MSTVWKYTLTPEKRQLVRIPEEAQILTVAAQNGEPVMWAEVDPDNRLTHRYFTVVGTGSVVPKGAFYHGTAFLGPLVFHVYEEVEPGAVPA